MNQRRIGALRRDLFPVLQEAGVDLYIAGHDHDMERLETGGMDFLINGGGGAKVRGIGDPHPPSVFSANCNGFLHLTITAQQLTAQFFDNDLALLDPAPLNRVK